MGLQVERGREKEDGGEEDAMDQNCVDRRNSK